MNYPRVHPDSIKETPQESRIAERLRRIEMIGDLDAAEQDLKLLAHNGFDMEQTRVVPSIPKKSWWCNQCVGWYDTFHIRNSPERTLNDDPNFTVERPKSDMPLIDDSPEKGHIHNFKECPCLDATVYREWDQITNPKKKKKSKPVVKSETV